MHAFKLNTIQKENFTDDVTNSLFQSKMRVASPKPEIE
jgi:hypothetical protein